MVFMMKQSKKRSVFLTFLVSYLLFLIIPMIIGSINYFFYSDTLRRKTEDYNLAMLRQVQSVIDERLASIEQHAVNISENRIIQNFINVKSQMNSNDILSMMAAIEEIRNYTLINTLVDDIYIYFSNSNVILTGSAKYLPEFYYNMKYSDSEYSYEDWINGLLSRTYSEYLLLPTNASVRAKNRVILSLEKSLRFEKKNKKSLATLGIILNEDKLKELLKDVDVYGNGAVCLYTRQDEVIAGLGDEKLMDFVNYENLVNGENNIYKSVQNSKVIVSFVPSKVTDWFYVSVVPQDSLLSELYTTRNITFFIILAGLLVGVMMAFLFSRKNTTPIKKLVVIVVK